MFVSVREYAHMHAGTSGDQKRLLIALEPELQAIVSPPCVCWEQDSGPLRGATRTLESYAISLEPLLPSLGKHQKNRE